MNNGHEYSIDVFRYPLSIYNQIFEELNPSLNIKYICTSQNGRSCRTNINLWCSHPSTEKEMILVLGVVAYFCFIERFPIHPVYILVDRSYASLVWLATHQTKYGYTILEVKCDMTPNGSNDKQFHIHEIILIRLKWFAKFIIVNKLSTPHDFPLEKPDTGIEEFKYGEETCTDI